MGDGQDEALNHGLVGRCYITPTDEPSPTYRGQLEACHIRPARLVLLDLEVGDFAVEDGNIPFDGCFEHQQWGHGNPPTGACVPRWWPWYLLRTPGPYWPVPFPSVRTWFHHFSHFVYCRSQIWWQYSHLLPSVIPPTHMPARAATQYLPTGGSFPPGHPTRPPALRPSMLLPSWPTIPPTSPIPNDPHVVVPFLLYFSLYNLITVTSGIRSAHIPRQVLVRSPAAVDATHGTKDLQPMIMHM